MDWWARHVQYSGEATEHKNSLPFFTSLRFNNNHLSQQVLNIKLILFRIIYNYVTKSFIYRRGFKNLQ